MTKLRGGAALVDKATPVAFRETPERVVEEFFSACELSSYTTSILLESRLALRWVKTGKLFQQIDKPELLAIALSGLQAKDVSVCLDSPGFGEIIRECERGEKEFIELALINLLISASKYNRRNISSHIVSYLDGVIPVYEYGYTNVANGQSLPLGKEDIAEMTIDLPVVEGYKLDPFDTLMDDEDTMRSVADLDDYKLDLVESLVSLGDPFESDVRAWITTFIPCVRRPYSYGGSSPNMTRAVFLNLIPNRPLDNAETIVHETQHTKLCVLLDFLNMCGYPALIDDSRFDLSSPWRKDKRPAEGVLHGVASYAAVAEFWSKIASSIGCPDKGAPGLALLKSQQVRRGVETLLKSGRLTDIGIYGVEQVVARMAAVGDLLGSISKREIDVVLNDPVRGRDFLAH